MIGRRTYLGELRHDEHIKGGAHEPLVSAALWRRAQNGPGRRTPRGGYLLSALARCAGCGRRMNASSQGRSPKKPPVYVCQCADCPDRYSTVTVERLDAEVTAQFFAHLDASSMSAPSTAANLRRPVSR
jgi:hypothetical protein